MKRVQSNTQRWALRLIAAMLASVAIHLLPFVVARRLGYSRPLQLEMHVNAVEIGLDHIQPGPRVAPLESHPAAPQLPLHPPPPERVHVASADRPPPVRARINDAIAVAPRPIPQRVDPPAAIHADIADAGTRPASTDSLPTIANAAGDLAPMVPRGALITILVRSDRIRRDPNAHSVRRLLSAIPDWNDMLGGTQLDPITDLDSIVLAAANPFGANGNAPDWFVLARGANGSDAAMRRAVEAMEMPEGSSRAPSPENPPDLDGGEPSATSTNFDAGRNIWHSEGNGIESVTLRRYGTRRSFVMLGDGTAAIALPGQVPALMSALARRGNSLVASEDPRLAVLIDADGLRNLISFNTWHGPFPIPTRAALGMYQMLEGDDPTGGIEIRSNWQYDNAAEATHAREMFEYSRGRWHLMIAEQLGAVGGLNRLFTGAVAHMVGIDIPSLESAIDALQFRVDGDRLVIHAQLSEQQMRAMMNVAALGGS